VGLVEKGLCVELGLDPVERSTQLPPECPYWCQAVNYGRPRESSDCDTRIKADTRCSSPTSDSAGR
jgi:hypothetical protein